MRTAHRHSRSVEVRGHVEDVRLERGFGFIRAGDGDLYFPASGLTDGLVFDQQLLNREVVCDVQVLADGRRRAINVRPAW
jgi:hypothetical protein